MLEVGRLPSKGSPGGVGRELGMALRLAKREMLRTLLSPRSMIILVLLLLLVVGGAYAMAQLYVEDEMATVNASIYKTPDSVLFMTSSFTAMMIPIAAVVLSFDALASERTRGTMALLLSKPMSREALALGKLLGALGSISVHILITTVSAVAIIAYYTGEAPGIWNSLAFIVMTIVLAGAYIGMTLAASFKTRNHGTAVMAGLAVWLVFTMFWLLIPLSLAYTMGLTYNVNDPDFLSFSNKVDAFNPNGAYNLCLMTSSGNGFFTLGVHPAFQVLSALLWFFAPSTAFIAAFGRSEG